MDLFVVIRFDGRICSIPAERRIAQGIREYLERITGKRYDLRAVTP